MVEKDGGETYVNKDSVDVIGETVALERSQVGPEVVS